jgi:tRNA-specific adenosine deaminase 2
MFRTGTLQRQAPWTPVVVASAALGLVLYYLHTRTSHPPSSASHLSQVTQQQPCQAPEDEIAAMDPEERAYHERFMREAIAMVNQPLLHPRQTKQDMADSSSP